MSDDDVAWTADRYRTWAQVEAAGSSATYERLARAVAGEERVLTVLASLERGRRQPNLLFAALRWVGIGVDDSQEAMAGFLGRKAEVLSVMLARRTQTNEVARCASLLPALARLPSPMAVVEVGASAGLCLMFDRWRYHYRHDDGELVLGDEGSPLTLDCTVVGPVLLPQAVPDSAWRRGLDLDAVDPSDPAARRWLSALVCGPSTGNGLHASTPPSAWPRRTPFPSSEATSSTTCPAYSPRPRRA